MSTTFSQTPIEPPESLAWTGEENVFDWHFRTREARKKIYSERMYPRVTVIRKSERAVLLARVGGDRTCWLPKIQFVQFPDTGMPTWEERPDRPDGRRLRYDVVRVVLSNWARQKLAAAGVID